MIFRRSTFVALIISALFVVGNLEIRAVPPEASAWSFPLGFQESNASHLWETDAIRADVTLAGISWEQKPPRAAWVRGSMDGEVWSDWAALVIEAEHGPDPGTDEARATNPASEPVYLGEVRWIQFRIDGQPGELEAHVVETAGRQRSLLTRVTDAWRRIAWREPSAGAAPGQPDIISRDVWGGDRCVGDKEPPGLTDGVRAMFIHHTATAGAYSEAAAPDVVYAICNYHANTRGWKDIGYNFLIDVYGNIYEGRAGGVDQPVWGAHTGGFNYYSFGVGLIADHNVSSVGAAAQLSLIELAAWKLDIHHVDPSQAITIESLGSTRYDQGVIVDMPTVAGHRDASSTSCPGNLCYPLLGGFRTSFQETGGAKIYGTGPETAPVPLGPTTFSFTITEPADWHFRLFDANEEMLLDESGSGTDVSIPWDGRIAGELIEPGDYRVSFTAVTGTGEVPRPVDQVITWYRAPFRDDDTSVHETSINTIAAQGITQGCSTYFDWWFCPDDEVPRDQMASFIARALGLADSDSDRFSDDDGNVHEGAINALADAGITVGCSSGGGYCPRRSISRAEMATFLYRALDLQPAGSDYFIDDDNNPHETAINAIAELGVTLGCGGERFCPNDPVMRAQMASFLDRAFISGP